jgi:hypothetical protein
MFFWLQRGPNPARLPVSNQSPVRPAVKPASRTGMRSATLVDFIVKNPPLSLIRFRRSALKFLPQIWGGD